MKFKDFLAGLELLKPYIEPENEFDWIHPEHDILYIGPQGEKVPDEIHEKLEELGFIWGDDVQSYYFYC